MWLVRSKRDKEIFFAADTRRQAIEWGARWMGCSPNMGYSPFAFPECIFDFQVVRVIRQQEGEDPEDFTVYVDWELDDNDEADSFRAIVTSNNATVLEQDFPLQRERP